MLEIETNLKKKKSLKNGDTEDDLVEIMKLSNHSESNKHIDIKSLVISPSNISLAANRSKKVIK
jgi:hypothetical protein